MCKAPRSGVLSRASSTWTSRNGIAAGQPCVLEDPEDAAAVSLMPLQRNPSLGNSEVPGGHHPAAPRGPCGRDTAPGQSGRRGMGTGHRAASRGRSPVASGSEELRVQWASRAQGRPRGKEPPSHNLSPTLRLTGQSHHPKLCDSRKKGRLEAEEVCENLSTLNGIAG